MGHIKHKNMVHAYVLSHFSCVQLCDPTDWDLPGSSVHGILYTRVLECPSPGDVPGQGIGPALLISPAFVGGFFTTKPLGKPLTALEIRG